MPAKVPCVQSVLAKELLPLAQKEELLLTSTPKQGSEPFSMPPSGMLCVVVVEKVPLPRDVPSSVTPYSYSALAKMPLPAAGV